MYEDLFNSLENNEEKTENIDTEKKAEPVSSETVEAKVEIPAEEKPIFNSEGYYRQSYVNNEYNAHNAQNTYQRPQQNPYQTQAQNPYGQQYSAPTQQSTYQNPYSAHTRYSNPTNNTNPYSQQRQQVYTPQVQKSKAPKAKMPGGVIAVIIVVCIILSGACGFGGTMLANSFNKANDTCTDKVIVHQVTAETEKAKSDLVDKSTSTITNEVSDSVVEITTEVMTTNQFFGQSVAEGAGSGVIISEDGYIITNNHVISGASSINVTTRSGDSYEAKLIGTDSEEDVALIKIEATGLTTAVFGDSSTISVGDKAVAIGNPLGTLGGTVTDGIISALDRKIEVDGQTMTLLQTDTAINPGNSGGGLFNGQGELVGLVVAKSSGSDIEGLGFAIPINRVLNVLPDLKEFGYVKGRPSTGCQFIDISNQMYAQYYFGNQNTGVYVYSVNGQNAAKAGMEPGERVVAVNGKEVSTSKEIEEIIDTLKAGDKVTFKLEYNNKTIEISYELEEETPVSKSQESNNNNNDFGSGGGIWGGDSDDSIWDFFR